MEYCLFNNLFKVSLLGDKGLGKEGQNCQEVPLKLETISGNMLSSSAKFGKYQMDTHFSTGMLQSRS